MKDKATKNFMFAAILLLAIVILGFGYITYSQTSNVEENAYDLKYNLVKGDHLVYSIVNTVTKPLNSVSNGNVDIMVTDIDENGKMGMRITSSTLDNGTVQDIISNLVTDSNGVMTVITSDDLVIDGAKPDMPNQIVYAGIPVEKDTSWSRPLNSNGSYVSNGTLTEYGLTGVANYTRIGSKTISNSLGNFDCVGVLSKVDYTLDLVSYTNNGTIYTTNICNYTGTSWVDINKGITVHSEFDLEKVMITDLSGVINQSGLFENLYRETPSTSHITSELMYI